MQFIQALAILAFTAFVSGAAEDNTPNSAVSLAVREVPAIKGRSPANVDLISDEGEPMVIDLDAVDNADLFKEIVARAGSCRNGGTIKRVKPEYNGYCNPANSRGLSSSHNCGGRSYLCVQSGQATCYRGKSVVKTLGLENGECFL